MFSKKKAIGVAIAAFLAAVALVLALEWRGNQPVTGDEAETVVRQGDLNAQRMQDTLTDQINSRPRSEAQLRMESETGLGLSRNCIQWTEFADSHPTEENRENRDRACQRYRDYVESGVLPEEGANAEATPR